MVKLKHILVNRDDLPDHVIEEVKDATLRISTALIPIIPTISPNILLAALGDFFTCLIVHTVNEEPENLRKAAMMNAEALVDGMERLIKSKGIK